MSIFSETQKKLVWEVLSKPRNEDPNVFRYDGCGALIKFDDYNNLESDFCWTIDHKFPVSLGGNEHPLNLHALHCKNNEKKANHFPNFEGAVQWNPNTRKNESAIITPFCVDPDLPNKISAKGV